MSGISLTAPMRSNLLSLQNIARQQDIVQNRLATGLKVSSAIDNPSSYYTAASLSNRAADLTALLDAMSQGVQTIKSASEAISSATKFLEQAKATANQALETSQPIAARVSTEEELLAAIESGERGLIVIDGQINLTDTQLVLNDGQSLVGNQYFGSNKISRLVATNNTTESLILTGNNSLISDLEINFISQSEQKFIILADNVQNTTLRNLTINYNAPNTGRGSNNSIVARNNAELKLEGRFISASSGLSTRFLVGSDNSKITIASSAAINHSAEGRVIRGIEFNRGSFLKIEKGSFINFDLHNTDSTSFAGIFMNGAIADIDGAEINIRLKGSTATGSGLQARKNTSRITVRSNSKINIETDVLQGAGLSAKTDGVIDIGGTCQINIKNKQNNSFGLRITDSGTIIAGKESRINIISDILAAFEQTTDELNSFLLDEGCRISWKNQDQSAQGIWQVQSDQKIIRNQTENIRGFDGWNGFNKLSSTANNIADIPDRFESDAISEKHFFTDNNHKQYIYILSQYDRLIKDASYKGINLLDGQKLKINFNEDRSSKVEVKGVKADSESLGLTTKEWNSQEDIEKSISELENAITSLRSFASAFGNYYSIVTTRQDFTENLINVLEEGADKLTLADMNEESANMLALQTSQQLAINSLSLASQAAQSVLKLF